MKRAYFALIFTILFVLIGPALLRAAQSAESIMADSSLRSTAPSTFLVAPSIPLGYAPSSVATGDLRQSGKLDLVTADYNSGGITVFLGDGQGNFAPGVKYDAGPHPSSVVVVDIDGDGRPDVLVSNESEGTISVLLGSGDGTLRPRQSYAVGFNPSFIATGDFNGNGKVDVAVAGESGSLLAILLNDGDGNLQKPVLRSLSKTPTALTVADFNNDGHADLALANADGTVSILLGKGAGLFRSLPDISVASGSLSSIVSGDLNKDGKTDLVVTQLGQKLVSVLIGRGDGTFVSPASYPVGNEPISTLVADVNGDGVPALVVINKSSNTFSILVGNGDGTFKSSVDFVAGNAPLAAVAGDFYGNGHVDLAIINHSSQTVSVPPGNGDGTFKAARSYPSGVQPVSIASGNLNGGKIPALVVANYCGSDSTCGTAGNVAVFLADDKGVYRLSSTYTVGAGPVYVALADLKGDRNLDIVALNRLDKTASVLLGLGDGTFRMPMTFSLAGAPVAIAVGDLNKDGKPDLAVLEDCGSAKCSQAGSVEILLGAGDGSFQSVSSYPVGYSPVSVAVGAINGDKNLDLVVANRCGKDASCLSLGTASVLLGDGTGKFTPGTDIALGNSPFSIALGNLTGSGLDLVVSRSADNTVAVLHGNGDGTFRAAVPYPVGNNPGSLVVADFNGDGNADVAVANLKDATVSVLYGRGDGTLQPAAALAVGSGPASLTAVGRTNSRHASLATANGNSGSPTPGTEFTVLANPIQDPALAAFTLAVNPTPISTVNDAVLLTATLKGASPNPAPTGTVTFISDPGSGPGGLSDCTDVTITQGVSPSEISTARCTTHMLTAGSDSLTAVYSGDPVYDVGVGATSPAVTQTVAQLSPTLALTTSSSSTQVNQPVTFTATLGSVAFTPIVPEGSVNFTVGAAPATTITGCGAQGLTQVAGVWTATCTTTSLAPGANQTIGAVYTGDTNFATATAPTISQTITVTAVNVTVGTSPAGLLVSVDGGAPTAAPLVETWDVGSSHTIATSSPQAGTTGVQYVWNSWSDSGAISHSITVPSTATTYTASFTTQYQLTTAANPSAGGSVTPATPTFYNASTVVSISASAAASYAFNGWAANSAIANTSLATTSITMNGPESATADFQAFAIAVPTTTVVQSSQNPSFTSAPNNSVTITASVTYSGSPVGANGSITFTDAGNPVAGGPTGPVALDVNGQASFTTTSLTEATHNILATYSGYGSVAASYLSSSGTVNQEVDNHTVQTGNQFCNPGAITVPNAVGAATPYPSRIFVSGYTANVGELTVTLNNIGSSNIPLTDLLLVGPTGAAIVPFADVGDGSTISNVNITLDDTASSLLPGSSPLTTGTFKPTSLTGSTTSLVFPSPAPTVAAANYAATDGSATLASTFDNTAPNGTWELFAMASSANGAASIGSGWCVTVTPTPQITITTSPANLLVSVDGGPATAAPLVETWDVGSSHTIATSSPQAGTTGVQYVWNSWSDSGAISHSITVPSTATTYTASFTTQYQLTTAASPSGDGTVAPTSGTYYPSGTSVPLQATANTGYNFSSWTGNVASTSSNPTSITMNAPQSVTANFVVNNVAVTLNTSPQGLLVSVDGGTAVAAPLIVPLQVGSQHTIATSTPQGTGGTQYTFVSWSDAGAISHTITVPATATAYTASFSTSYLLTTGVSPSGGGTVAPPTGYQAGNSTVPLTATPAAGYVFSSWTGPVASASSASTTVTMSAPETVTANFISALTVSPYPSYSFGTVYLGTLTTENFTVSNTGTTPITMNGPFISILQGGDSEEFVEVDECPKALAAGSHCTISVTFVAGPFYSPQTAILTIMDNAPGNPQRVTLTATVIDPQASFTPRSLSFGTQSVGIPTTKTVTLKNTGATMLSNISMTVTGTNAAEFTPSSTCGSSLASGSSCTISMTFEPVAKASYSATLQVTDNTQSGKQTVPLSGTGH